MSRVNKAIALIEFISGISIVCIGTITLKLFGNPFLYGIDFGCGFVVLLCGVDMWHQKR